MSFIGADSADNPGFRNLLRENVKGEESVALTIEEITNAVEMASSKGVF